MSELSLDEILEITKEAPVLPQQSFYLRRSDKELRCLSRRCGSPTHYKVIGIPLCQTHALEKLVELIEAKEQGHNIDNT